tara:strand:- start:118 stop:417 length:300 start_codon:yes stop_codon:yes gene_type:complete
MITHKDRRHDTDHTTRMRVRRARQNARTPGFTPVVNQRIALDITRAQMALTMSYQARVEDEKDILTAMPSDSKIKEEATRMVARTLPSTPIGVRVNRGW